MLPDGARPNQQNNIRELSSGDPRRLWTGKAVTYLKRADALEPATSLLAASYFGNSSHFLS
jgi:hypothetical protein